MNATPLHGLSFRFDLTQQLFRGPSRRKHSVAGDRTAGRRGLRY